MKKGKECNFKVFTDSHLNFLSKSPCVLLRWTFGCSEKSLISLTSTHANCFARNNYFNVLKGGL